MQGKARSDCSLQSLSESPPCIRLGISGSGVEGNGLLADFTVAIEHRVEFPRYLAVS